MINEVTYGRRFVFYLDWLLSGVFFVCLFCGAATQTRVNTTAICVPQQFDGMVFLCCGCTGLLAKSGDKNETSKQNQTFIFYTELYVDTWVTITKKLNWRDLLL